MLASRAYATHPPTFVLLWVPNTARPVYLSVHGPAFLTRPLFLEIFFYPAQSTPLPVKSEKGEPVIGSTAE